MKKRLSFILAIIMLLSIIPNEVHAESQDDEQSIVFGDDLSFIAGFIVDDHGTVRRLAREQGKFASSKGHGFAAEEANNLIDRISGKNSTVVGDNNIKNGADRRILGRDGTAQWIQDKYWKTAKESIDACFENGKFRYRDSTGKPMQIEVPKDQYKEAIKIMEEKIKAGEMANCGITDPKEANSIVKEGKITYKQAKNITKAGNIDSIVYDSVNGAIVAGSAMGISFAIDYAICKMNGNSNSEALQTATIDSFKTGGIVFASSVISSQISKTGVGKALSVNMEKLTGVLGPEFAEGLAKACGKNVAGEAAVKYASKILSSNVLMTAITFGILEIKDVSDIIQGRISKEQLLKNLSITLATLIGCEIGAVGGGAIGALTSFGAGTAVGALIGSLVGAGLANNITSIVISQFIEDDADEMYSIIEVVFQALSEDYMVSQTEADAICVELKNCLTDDILKDMFQSEDRQGFAEKILEPLFEKQITKRKKIEIATTEEARWKLKESLKGIVFIH